MQMHEDTAKRISATRHEKTFMMQPAGLRLS
jgi:hypothetical protein